MMRAALALCLGLLLPVQATESGRGWLCVGSPEFLRAASPLIEHRRSQGLNVVLADGPVAEAVAGCAAPPAFVLILGDEVRSGPPDSAAAWRIAAARQPFHGWTDSHPEEFVSDMVFGDHDDDGLPDASVGRIPARCAADVAAAAEKIVRWEKRAPGVGDLAVPVWAGDPGFAAIFRDMALAFLFTQVRQRAPLWTELWIIQGDERSPFCGWPADQQSVFNSRMQSGGLISAMIGHGRPSAWWSMDVSGGRLEYAVTDAALLTGVTATPPHVIFACACGDFAFQGGECLTEALFRAPGGPVLCVGAAEDSHPLTNYYHSTALLDCLDTAEPRFGDLWLRSLRKANGTTEADKELLVHVLEPLMINKSLSTADLRADHAMLYNIMGDPATRVFAPRKLAAEIIEKDGQWQWKVPHPLPGAKLLVQRRKPLPEFLLSKTAVGRTEAGQRLKEANEALQFKTVTEIPAGENWEGTTAGPGTLRLIAMSSTGLAVAAAPMVPTVATAPGPTAVRK